MIADLKANPPPIPVDEIAEAIQFLEWLVANNFTLMGVRDYLLTADESDYAPQSEGSLGVLRAHDFQVLRRGNDLAAITPEIMEFLREPKVLIIAKANVRSRIHRRVYLDYVGIKRYSPDGRLTGEFRIVGLFTSTAYTHQARAIPYLRRKVDRVLTRAGFRAGRPSRQGAGQRARNLSARRTVSDRRRSTLRICAGDSLSRRASARARAGAA